MTEDDDKRLTPQQVAVYLGVTVHTVYQYLAQGVLCGEYPRHHKRRRWTIYLSDVEEMIATTRRN